MPVSPEMLKELEEREKRLDAMHRARENTMLLRAFIKKYGEDAKVVDVMRAERNIWIEVEGEQRVLQETAEFLPVPENSLFGNLSTPEPAPPKKLGPDYECPRCGDDCSGECHTKNQGDW